MEGSLDLIPSESEQPVYFSQNWVRVAAVVLKEVKQVFIDELKFLLGYGFEDVFIVVREEEELSASAALALN